MKNISDSEAQKNLLSIIKQVCKDNTHISITTENNKTAVILSLTDYNQLKQAVHLLENYTNSKDILHDLGKHKQ